MMLIWPRMMVIMGWRTWITAYAVLCMTGCSAIQRAFNPVDSVTASELVETATANSGLWWPFMLTGFIALVAGIINLVFLRGGAKLLVIGVLLALTPPISEMVLTSIMPWIALVVGLAGLALVGIVVGRVVGRRDIGNRAAQRAEYLLGNGTKSVSSRQAAKMLTHLADKNFKPDYKIKG